MRPSTFYHLAHSPLRLTEYLFLFFFFFPLFFPPNPFRKVQVNSTDDRVDSFSSFPRQCNWIACHSVVSLAVRCRFARDCVLAGQLTVTQSINYLKISPFAEQNDLSLRKKSATGIFIYFALKNAVSFFLF